MTESTQPYATPAAFRQALGDHLRAIAKASRWELPQLQRQFAYDRLLERLYIVDQAWVVKGATALLARDIGVRGTLDVDLYRNASRQAAEPDRQLWEQGYRVEAENSLLPLAKTLDEALATVAPFADPLFAGEAAGSWDPKSRHWA